MIVIDVHRMSAERRETMKFRTNYWTWEREA